MGDKIKQHRILAVQRFKNGESPESICTSLGKSKVWLYKWIKRYSGEETSWCEDRSRHSIRKSLTSDLRESLEIALSQSKGLL